MSRVIRFAICAALALLGLFSNLALGQTKVKNPIRSVRERPVILMAVGDIMLDRGLRKKIGSFGSDYPFALVTSVLRKADIVVGNLECPLSDREFEVTQQFRFRAQAHAPLALQKAGFHVLNLANNHTMDCGQSGLGDTIDRLATKGIRSCGAGKNHDNSLVPTLFDAGGIKIAILGFCDFDPHLASVREDQPMIAQTNKSDMKRAILRARREGSIVIVNFHWGVEQSTVVTSRQQDLANFAIESGADIITGHHPHVLQPVEERIVIRNGQKRHCVIAWSLGNFVFDGHKDAEKQSMILEVALGNEGVRGFRILPIVIEHSRPKLANGTTPSH